MTQSRPHTPTRGPESSIVTLMIMNSDQHSEIARWLWERNIIYTPSAPYGRDWVYEFHIENSEDRVLFAPSWADLVI